MTNYKNTTRGYVKCAIDLVWHQAYCSVRSVVKDAHMLCIWECVTSRVIAHAGDIITETKKQYDR